MEDRKTVRNGIRIIEKKQKEDSQRNKANKKAFHDF